MFNQRIRIALFLFVLLAGSSMTAEAQVILSNVDSALKVLPTTEGEEAFELKRNIIWTLWRADPDTSLLLISELIASSEEVEQYEYVAWGLNVRGIILGQRGEIDSSMATYGEALKVARQHKVTVMEKKISMNLGINHFYLGDYDQALENLFTALRLCEMEEDTLGMAHALSNMANVYNYQDKPEKAIANNEKAIQYYEQVGFLPGLANTLNNQGTLFEARGDTAEAREAFLRTLELKRQLNDKFGMGSTYLNLGNLSRTMGDIDKAKYYYEKGGELNRENGNQRGVTNALINLGSLQLEQKNYREAKGYLLEALKIAKAIPDLEFQVRITGSLARVYRALEQHKEAFSHLQENKTLTDSLSNTETNARIAELEISYETEKKEKQLLLQEAAILKKEALLRKSNTWLMILGGVLVLLFVIAFFTLRQQALRRERAELNANLAEVEGLRKLQEERIRISRDLHDHIGAEVTLIISELDQKAFTQPEPELKEELSEIADSARFAMTQLRETIWAIRTDEIDLEAFVARLREFGGKAATASQTQVKVELQAAPNKVLSPNQTLNLYRIAQEAIQNAVKYAAADRVNIALSEGQDGNLELEISDNGKGFDPKNVESGYGLANMEARAFEIGAEWQLHSAPGKGTRISIRLKG